MTETATMEKDPPGAITDRQRAETHIQTDSRLSKERERMRA